MKTRARLFWLFGLLSPFLLAGSLLFGPSGIGMPDLGTAAGQSVFLLRVNRMAGGLAVGAALSCAGVVFQALLRNPLAEPYILGVSSGAGLGAAFAILVGFGAANVFALPLTAFLAAAVTLAIVFVLASDGAAPSVYGLILSGVIVSAVCSSVLMFLVATSPVEGLHSVLWWMLGSLQPNSSELLAVCAVLVVAAGAGAWALAPELNALTLGTETAHYVGVRTGLVVTLGLGLATLLTSAAVGLAGLIGFVGLIVPHVTRSLVGPDHRRLIPAAALGGGVFLVLCDAAARTVMAPVELPVGVVTAVCGGPFFLTILRHRRKQGWIG
jgi:iron complex transport system permease protein